jgi:hypothetical protein
MTELYGWLQDHAAAMLDLLYDVGADLVVFPAEGGGPTIVPAGTPPPFVSVHFAADRPLGGRLTMLSTRFRMRSYAHCVGANDIAARAVSDLVAAAWLDVRPVILGRSVYPIRSELSRDDPRPDQSTGTEYVTITDTYRLESDNGVGGS